MSIRISLTDHEAFHLAAVLDNMLSQGVEEPSDLEATLVAILRKVEA